MNGWMDGWMDAMSHGMELYREHCSVFPETVASVSCWAWRLD